MIQFGAKAAIQYFVNGTEQASLTSKNNLTVAHYLKKHPSLLDENKITDVTTYGTFDNPELEPYQTILTNGDVEAMPNASTPNTYTENGDNIGTKLDETNPVNAKVNYLKQRKGLLTVYLTGEGDQLTVSNAQFSDLAKCSGNDIEPRGIISVDLAGED